MPTFPARAAVAVGADPEAVGALLTNDAFRRQYWSGDLPEDAFWQALGLSVPSPGERAAILGLGPLIDPARVAAWREIADVWVISNHRHEWLLPVLAAHGFDAVVDRIEVSSMCRRVKPDPGAWAALLADGTHADRVAVVDDQARNLDAARGLGITAFAATGDLEWADRLDAWLQAA
jgi:FMN phosphatase YigB (HAD superfamily)